MNKSILPIAKFQILFILIIFSFPCLSQDYKEMMNNPKYNVYEVKEKAEEYFDVHGKGSGWKGYQRWLYINEPRFYPSGDRNIFASLPDLKIAHGKSLLKSAKETAQWEELGPVSTRYSETDAVTGIGRVDPVWVDPDNEKYMLIGSRTGGFWKTIDGGNNWECLTSDLNVIGVNAIAVSHTDKNVIYIGSSGGNNYWTPYGKGVLKSYDGGDTWEKTAIASVNDDNLHIREISIHPNDANLILIATNKGLYKSTDGLKTATITYSGNILNVLFNPGRPSNVYLSLDQGTFNIYKSINTAESFVSVSVSSSEPQINYLAVTAADSKYVYIANDEGVWRSEDKGSSFNFRGMPDNPLWEGFAVSQTNPEVLFYGEKRLNISHDGGVTYFVRHGLYNYPNLDKFAGWDFRYITNVNGTFYYGCDAFFGKSIDDGFTFDQLHKGGIGIRENYKISSSVVDPELMLAGSQDHGTYLLNHSRWTPATGGDGMWNGFDRDEANVFFTTSQYGSLRRTENGGDSYVKASPPNMDGEGGWITPYVIDENLDNTIYGGFKKVFKSINNGRDWTEISDEIFGGLLNNLEVAPTNSNILYASRKNRLWKTANGGDSWNEITSGLPNLHINDIEINPDDETSVLLSYSGFDSGAKVYRSDDGGTSWENISTNLPNIPALCLAYDKGNHHPIYLGMDLGAYYTDDNLDEWIPFMENLPMATVRDLEINYTNNKLRAGIWGRGLWQIDRMQTSPTISDYCFAFGNSGTGGDYISKVELNEINKSSGKSANLYSNFLSSETILNMGETYTLNVTLANHWDPDRVYAWIDWNQNLAFENNELVLSAECDAEHVATTDIVIPNDAKPGKTRMRVRNQYDASAAPEQCGGSFSGEVEDYTVEVVTGGPVANFAADKRVIEAGEEISFKSLSTNNPESWTWTFEGAVIGSSTEQNPVTTYDVAGNYTVTHTAVNSLGEGVKTKTAYIKVVEDLQPPQKPVSVFTKEIEKLEITIGWEPPANSEEVTGYNIYLGSRIIATVTNLEYYIIGLDPGTTYKMYVTALDASGNESEKAMVEATTIAAYCVANGTSWTGSDYISKVVFGDISKSSGKSTGLYEDFTNLSTDVLPGNSYSLKVTLNTHWAPDRVFTWIDWNGNKSFENTELVMDGLPESNHITTVSVVVPNDAVDGEVRMRVRNQYDENASGTPCGSSFAGEVEDYSVNVKNPTGVDLTKDDGLLYNISPNPVSNVLSIISYANKTVNMKLVNISGELVYIRNNQGFQPGQPVKLHVSHLQPGIYILEIKTTEGQRNQFKIVVQ